MIFEGSEYPGLNGAEAAKRAAAGLANGLPADGRTAVCRIIRRNVLTFFNLLNLILFIAIIGTGSFKNGLFFLVIIINTSAAAYEELRAKKELDAISILARDPLTVIRDGKPLRLAPDQLVLGDQFLLGRGSQVPSDARMIAGTGEANESLLTGESLPLAKQAGDFLYAGSFITAGTVLAEVEKVGSASYASGIAKAGRTLRPVPSQLQSSLDRIMKAISLAILPIGAGLFFRLALSSGWRPAILGTVSALVGMIPEGLILLTTLALVMGTVKLARQRVLVQRLYAIESLARTDVICLDKTGTLTEGKLEIAEVIRYSDCPLEAVIGNLLGCLGDHDPTSEALRSRYPDRHDYSVIRKFPFSSSRKYSGAAFAEGNYCYGALDFLTVEADPAIRETAGRKAREGCRVLAVSEGEEPRRIIALIMLRDRIRPAAAATLAYLGRQGVSIKVISGDDPQTAAAVAGAAGVPGAQEWVDLSSVSKDYRRLAERYTVFGRVTPDDKRGLIEALKESGRHPAMVGDGVNDILAFKSADCSVCMAAGADAARQAADIVLLDSDFRVMPAIIDQGRRVINNISAATALFLIKTGFSVILAAATIISGLDYPYEPIQLTVLSGCFVGLPAFFLAFEPNYSRPAAGYFRSVLAKSLPAALAIALTAVLTAAMHPQWRALLFCLTGFNYLLALLRIYQPLRPYRTAVIGVFSGGFLALAYFLRELIGINGSWEASQFPWLAMGMAAGALIQLAGERALGRRD